MLHINTSLNYNCSIMKVILLSYRWNGCEKNVYFILVLDVQDTVAHWQAHEERKMLRSEMSPLGVAVSLKFFNTNTNTLQILLIISSVTCYCVIWLLILPTDDVVYLLLPRWFQTLQQDFYRSLEKICSLVHQRHSECFRIFHWNLPINFVSVWVPQWVSFFLLCSRSSKIASASVH